MNLQIEHIPKLVYSSDEEQGYTRRPWGRGFTYLDWEGKRLKDRTILKRIKSLVIPPVWEEVWICPLENGHLQSTGRDPKKRKQYIYHPDWMRFQQQKKFDKLVHFAEQLPKLRQTTRLHLQDEKWTRRKVLALIVQVLDECYIRIGNLQYKERNNTYGLTTLRRKHVDVASNHLSFSYKAKSNQYREVNIEDQHLVQLIKECSELPGYEVFRYRSGSKTHPVDSSEVNAYVQTIMGEQFYSKDFRTWAGTSLAVKYVEAAREESEQDSRRTMESCLIKKVASDLGNTVSVCRDYYIHPKVLAAAVNNELPSMESVAPPLIKRFENELEPHEIVTYQVINS
ncbi:MAG: DNA topoisomerase IB [Bacteroidota bacterium]